jgi:hypothetical protein
VSITIKDIIEKRYADFFSYFSFLVDTIMSFNVFGCPASSLASHKNLLAGKEESEKGHHSCGIWTQASYINHRCTSTARRAFIGDMMVIRATRDMEAGTEITFWYHSPIINTVADLQKKLDSWDFVCDCAICDDGRAISVTVMAERKKILLQTYQGIRTNTCCGGGTPKYALVS